MQQIGHHRTSSGCPFPPALPFPRERKSSALEEEDRFMELHGGSGSRIIYQSVCLAEAALGGAVRFLRGVITLRWVRTLISNMVRRPLKSDQPREI
jgi:hypothetical protein